MIGRTTRIVLRFAVVLCAVIAFDASAAGQGAVKKMTWDELGDYVNESGRDGERLLVTDVPLPEKVEFISSNRLYLFQPAGEGNVAKMFYTSKAVTNVLRRNLNSLAKKLRIACTLIRLTGSFDVFRSPFATKVEGLDEDGKVIWIATGPPPAKLRFPQ